MVHDAATADTATRRWEQVLDSIADMLPDGARSIVVDGFDQRSALVADRLAAALHAVGRPCSRLTDTNRYGDEDAWYADRTAHTIALADGPRWRSRRTWDVVLWVRTHGHGHDRREPDRYGEAAAGIVVDLHDPDWPVIRPVATSL